MSGMPANYQKTIGTYRNIKSHGVDVTVVVDTIDSRNSETITKAYLTDFRSHVDSGNNAKVVGVHLKKKKPVALDSDSSSSSSGSKTYLLALHTSNCSLVFHLDNSTFPEVIYKFFTDNEDICLVGPAMLFQQCFSRTFITSPENSSKYRGIGWNLLIVRSRRIGS